MPDLYPFQEEGAEHLASRPYALIADAMGLGKTPQAIRALQMVAQTPPKGSTPGSIRHGPVYIFAPLATLLGWKREIALWAPEYAGHTRIVRRTDPLPTL